MINYIYSIIERQGICNSAEDIAIMIYNGECEWSEVQEAVDLFYDANQVMDDKMDFLNQIQNELDCIE